jgi:hypothetical protein
LVSAFGPGLALPAAQAQTAGGFWAFLIGKQNPGGYMAYDPRVDDFVFINEGASRLTTSLSDGLSKLPFFAIAKGLYDSIVYSKPEYVTPDPVEGDPSRFRRGPSGTKINNDDESVWDRNRGNGHGGDQWKRWPNVKDWENGRGRESVWPDGRVRGK